MTTPEELEYRRFHMQPNPQLFRERYTEAVGAKDTFAARFYLDQLIDYFEAKIQPGELNKWRTERAKYPDLAPPPGEELENVAGV